MNKILFLFFFLLIVGYFGLKLIKSPQGKFTLEYQQGSVFFKINQDYQQLNTDKINLGFGSWIKTTDGLAKIIFSDGSIVYLDQNTEIQINNKTGVIVYQTIGNTWHQIKKITGIEDSYQVQTPTALAVVRGTNFAVLVTNQQSLLIVDEGQIEVNSNKVSEKQFISINQKGTFIDKINQDIINLPWYQKYGRVSQITISPTNTQTKTPSRSPRTPTTTSTPKPTLTLIPTITPSPIPTLTPTPTYLIKQLLNTNLNIIRTVTPTITPSPVVIY